MTDLKLPTRPAPAPPCAVWTDKKGNVPKQTTCPRDSFLHQFKLSRSQSAGKLGETKKPPPRPPPPKQKQQPSLSSMFHNKPSQISLTNNQTFGSFKKQVPDSTGHLIDLNSPPSSPTHTSPSSSDHFSYGSLQGESGFEDDFDLLTLSNATSSITDLWGDGIIFYTKQLHQPIVPFDLSNEDPRCKHKVITDSASAYVRPTIIRTKTSKPARPPPPKLRPSSTPPTFLSSSFEEWSPPMPNCPPPPPPPEVLETLEHAPTLPPRPLNLRQENLKKKEPYCIALYDYVASHPDDLSFKAKEVIHLKARVNEEWLQGSINNREGIFPASYANIVVPLEDVVQDSKFVLALYTFTPESWDDLPFQEGETIKVTKRVNENWLYGECNGREGLFPATYITEVPPFMPLQ